MQSLHPQSDDEGWRKVQSWVRATQSPTHWKKKWGTAHLKAGDWVTGQEEVACVSNIWFQIFVPNINNCSLSTNTFSPRPDMVALVTTWTLRRSCFGLGLCVGPLVPVSFWFNPFWCAPSILLWPFAPSVLQGFSCDRLHKWPLVSMWVPPLRQSKTGLVDLLS